MSGCLIKCFGAGNCLKSEVIAVQRIGDGPISESVRLQSDVRFLPCRRLRAALPPLHDVDTRTHKRYAGVRQRHLRTPARRRLVDVARRCHLRYAVARFFTGPDPGLHLVLVHRPGMKYELPVS